MGECLTATAFVFTLVATLIVSFIVVTYSMHCLLVVVRDTADGQDDVVWSSEPLHDWAGGALHLVVVIVVWLAPVGILARAMQHDWLPDNDALRFFLLAVPGLWLLFPIALFSSLSGSSRWFVFRPVVVWKLLRVAPAALAVYFLSAVLAAGAAGLGYAAIRGGWAVLLLPVAAAGSAAALLIYARLLGRLAASMGRLSATKRKTAKMKSPKIGRVEVQDPWAMPKGSEPESDPTPVAQPRRKIKTYALAVEKSAPPPPQPPPSEGERQYVERSKRIAPRTSLFAGVFTLPWRPHSRKPWALLSLGFLTAGAFAWLLVYLYCRLFKIS